MLQDSFPGLKIEEDKINTIVKSLQSVVIAKVASHNLFEKQAEKREQMRQKIKSILAEISKDTCELLDLKQAHEGMSGLGTWDLHNDKFSKDIYKGLYTLRQQYNEVIKETGVELIINKESSTYKLLMSHNTGKIALFLEEVSKLLPAKKERHDLQVEKIIENLPPEVITRMQRIQAQIDKDISSDKTLKNIFGIERNVYKFQNLIGMGIKDQEIQKAVAEITSILSPITEKTLNSNSKEAGSSIRKSVGRFTESLNKKAETSKGDALHIYAHI